jgi:short-subunit dehydrogenase
VPHSSAAQPRPLIENVPSAPPKTALVVGGSGAFGSRFVEALSRDGYRVLATASSDESAQRIPNVAALRLLLDLENPTSVKTLSSYLAAAEQLDLIVVASGRVGFGLATSTSVQNAERLMRINCLGVVQLITEAKTALKQGAKLIAITGVVAARSFPGMSAYSASKAALASWLNGVRQEWRRDGISVLDAQPGHTETGLADRPLFGEAPSMPLGMNPDAVVARILSALGTETQLLRAEDFG